MAHEYLSIPISLYRERRFEELTIDQQWTFLLVATRGEHSWLGVLPVTLNRWARTACDALPEVILDDLRTLNYEGWVVLDESTDEVFVPRFMEFNRVHRSPGQLRSAIQSAREVISPRIQSATADVFETFDRLDAKKAAAEIRRGVKPEKREKRALRPTIPTAVRRAVYERDGWRCVYCLHAFAPVTSGAPEDEEFAIWLELDHRVPYSLGGADVVENLRAACSTCNRRRGVDDLDLWAEKIGGL
jgi:hypothetical protein